MNEYIIAGIIVTIIVVLVLVFKKKKGKENETLKSADTVLPTPPKPTKDKEPD